MSFLQSHKLIHKGIEPETISAIARISSKPSSVDALNYDTLIKEIKVGHSLVLGVNNLSSIIRLLHIGAAHSTQTALINWAVTGFDGIVATLDAQPGGSLGLTPYKGVSSISGSYISITSSVLLDTYRLNGSFSTYLYDNVSLGQNSFGSSQTNGNANVLFARGNGVISGRFNQVGGGGVSVTLANAPGLYTIRRTGNTVQLCQDGVQKFSINGVNDMGGIAIPTGLGLLGNARNDVVAGTVPNHYVSCWVYGVYAINLLVIKNAIENFMAKYP
jgi:hypothetical protein